MIRGLHCQIAPQRRRASWSAASGARSGTWRSTPARARRPSARWVAAELSAENWSQLWIPAGFLHGFCTLEPDTEVIYKVTDPYDREAERGVIWNDPDLALPWPVADADAVLSDKDRVLPRWSELPTLFGSACRAR